MIMTAELMLSKHLVFRIALVEIVLWPSYGIPSLVKGLSYFREASFFIASL